LLFLVNDTYLAEKQLDGMLLDVRVSPKKKITASVV
jgi:hypothetical protein